MAGGDSFRSCLFSLGCSTFMVLVKMQDSSKAERDLGFKQMVPVEEGVGRMVEWFRDLYGLLR